MIEEKNIDYKLHHWGPCLMGTKCPDNVVSYLLDAKNKIDEDARSTLAGHIEKELFFKQEHKRFFIEHTKHIFSKYIDILTTEWNPMAKMQFDTMELDKFWINTMKAGEFNPMHTHSGQISFVIFIKVDPEINEEHKTTICNHSGPGVLEFHYGQYMKNEIGLIHRYEVFPEVGDMFVFPAYLQHMVVPFKSKNAERISCSGNIFLKSDMMVKDEI